MISTNPVESFGELPERFPGIEQLDPVALGRFAFHAARHLPSEDFRYHQTDEDYQEWHHEIRDVLSEVEQWRSWGNQDISRAEMAGRIVSRRQKEAEAHNLISVLAESTPDEGYGLVEEYLEKGGYRLQTEVSPSPLFPEGRTVYTNLSDAKDPDSGKLHIPYGSVLVDNEGNELNPEISEFFEKEYPRYKAHEQIKAALTEIGEVDKAKFEELRARYGAKAAGLMCFDEKASQLKEALKDNGYSVDVEVPPFKPVSTDMYEAWLNGSDNFAEMSETLRAEILQLGSDRYVSTAGLVVIRSSAVKSEDGDEHSGAGVYKSIAVDPHDSDAFRKAIEEVYASARSNAALTYQQSVGVTDELMGLVIQQYLEETGSGRRKEMFYGHANGSGVNRNLIEVNTNEGMLLYDKPAVQKTLLLQDSDSHNGGDLLHTHPDHDSALRSAIYKTATVPHAVVLAEQIFGKPMQVEFVNGSIVQVRPLNIKPAEISVSFPEDLDTVAESAASGLGDMELERLDEADDNSDKKGFVMFWREYEFTINRSHAGYNAFPKEGAVIVLNPSSSGHIQAICREKGLMCFYPKKGSSIDHLEDIIFESNGRFRGEPRDIKLRFVADGYDGKIYDPATES